MTKFLWLIAMLGSIAGGLLFISGMGQAESAPQEAAIAAMAVALAVIPYCLARSVAELSSNDSQQNKKEVV